MRPSVRASLGLAVIAALGGVLARAQNASRPAPAPSIQAIAASYEGIVAARLDANRVYRIDGLDIDDEDVHISLLHGTLALGAPVVGAPNMRLALFSGQGEVLVMPPDAADRLSMANFTGADILDEQFQSAYFCFTDGALRLDQAELATALPAATAGRQFVERWQATVASLDQMQAIRVLAEVLNHDRTPYFYARIGGIHLGQFQVMVDRSRPEQVAVSGEDPARPGREDVWASFPMRSVRNGRPAPAPDDEEIEMESYRVETDIGADMALAGDATATFRARVSGDQVLTFNLARGLTVQSVQDGDGHPLDFVQFGILHEPGTPNFAPPENASPVIAVICPEALAAGRDYQLRFRYQGRIIFAAAHGLFAIADRADWYPNRPGLPATHDLTFTYPGKLTLIATGAQAAPPNAPPPPPGYRQSRWLSSKRLVLAGFSLGDYTEASAQANSAQGPIPVNVYGAKPESDPGLAAGGVPPAPTPAQLAGVAQQTARTIEFYERRFGPFPYSRLSVTELPLRLGQGWPGLLYVATDSFLSPQQLEDLKLPAEARSLFPLMRPHEIAHQWWGDEVGWRDYHDQWLAEALATYSSLLYLEAQPGGEAAMHAALEEERQALLRSNAQGKEIAGAGPIWLGIRLNSGRFPDAYDVITYDKGAWFLHMMREMLRGPFALGASAAAAPLVAGPAPDPRDDRFFALLRDFVRTYSGRSPSTSDFERVAERHWPQRLDLTQDGSLDWFFREWLQWTAIPRYAVAHEHWTKTASGSREIGGTLQQEKVPEDFLMPVPLYVRLAPDRLAYLGTVIAQGANTSFAFALPSGPAPGALPEIAIDPYGTILKR